MYCKKCGTEQKEGQKFCPKCGEPFIEENEKSHADEFKKYAQNAVDEFKKIDWNEKREKTLSFIKEFINNPNKIGLATKVVACLFALWFLVKMGFSASILWYIVLATMLYVAFKGIPKIKTEGLKSLYLSLCVCLGLGLSTIFASSSNNGDFSLFGKDKGPHEICVSLSATVDKHYNIVQVSGSHGGESNSNYYMTKIITIPKGKMWLYKDFSAQLMYNDKCFVPSICYFSEGREDGRYKEYSCKNARDIPVFRSGDVIKIVALKNTPPPGKNQEQTTLWINFIEKDDDFSSQ